MVGSDDVLVPAARARAARWVVLVLAAGAYSLPAPVLAQGLTFNDPFLQHLVDEAMRLPREAKSRRLTKVDFYMRDYVIYEGFTQAPSDPLTLYVTTAEGYVYVTRDGGKSWHESQILVEAEAPGLIEHAWHPRSGAPFEWVVDPYSGSIGGASIRGLFSLPNRRSMYCFDTTAFSCPLARHYGTLQGTPEGRAAGRSLWGPNFHEMRIGDDAPDHPGLLRAPLTGFPSDYESGKVLKRPPGLNTFKPALKDFVAWQEEDLGGRIVQRDNYYGDWLKLRTERSTRVRRVSVNPRDPAHALAATNDGLFETRDAGQSWALIMTGPPGEKHIATTAFDPVDPQRILVATKDGLRYSDNGGIDFMKLLEDRDDDMYVSTSSIRSLTYHPKDPKRVCAGLDYGIICSKDGGRAWDYLYFVAGSDSNNVGSVAHDPDNVDGIVFASYGGGVFRTTDWGEKWEDVAPFYFESAPTQRVVLDPRSGKHMLVAQEQLLWESFDGGENWHAVDLMSTDWHIHSVTFDQANPEIVWVLTDKELLRLEPDGPSVPTQETATLLREHLVTEPSLHATLDMSLRSSLVHHEQIESVRERHHWSHALPNAHLAVAYVDSRGAADTKLALTSDGAFDAFGTRERSWVYYFAGLWLAWDDMPDLVFGEHDIPTGGPFERAQSERRDIEYNVRRAYDERLRVLTQIYSESRAPLSARMARYLRLEELTVSLDQASGGLWATPLAWVHAHRPVVQHKTGENTMISGLVLITVLGSTDGVSPEVAAQLHELDREPTIQEVHGAVLRHYGISHEFIADRRSAVNWKHAVPVLDVSGDYVRSEADDNTLDTVIDPNAQSILRDASGRSWSTKIKMTWALPQLVFNPEEFDVMSTTRVMESLQKEVTSTYYFRKRMMVSRILNPSKDTGSKIARDLRIDELTTNIDVMTGGWFSKEIEARKNGAAAP